MARLHERLAACSPNAVKVWHAVVYLTETGQPRTSDTLGEITGLRRRTLHRARVELQDAGLLPSGTDEHRDQTIIDRRIPALPPPDPTDPPWLTALRPRLESTTRHRSWRLLEDVFGPTFDDLLHSPIDEPIGLCCFYVELVDGVPPSKADRNLIAKLVRCYGKAALWGIGESLGVTMGDLGRDRYRYARQVAARLARNSNQHHEGDTDA